MADDTTNNNDGSSTPLSSMVLPPTIVDEQKEKLNKCNNSTQQNINNEVINNKHDPSSQSLADNNTLTQNINNDNITSSSNENVSSSSSDDAQQQNHSKSKHRNRSNNFIQQNTLQPTMGPIISTPCLDPINPSSIHSNNGDLLNSNDSNNDSPISPSLNEPILNQQTFQPLARSQNIDSNSNEHSKILPQKYQILHTNPILSLSQSQDDEIQQTQSLSQNKRNGSNSSGFLPMQSKPSVNLDNNSRLISNEVLTASDVHDEDQKYIEKLSPSNSHQPGLETKHDHDPSSPPSPTNNDNITKTNQHRSNKGNQSSNNNQNIPSNVNNNNSNNGFYQHSFHHQSQTQSVPPILPIGGIPTTPSYATPLSGPVLNEWSNRNQYLSIHQQQGHSIASQQGPPQILSRSHGLPTQHNTLIPPTQGTPLLSGQSVPIGVAGSGGSHHTGQIPSGPPSVVGSIGGISNSYRRGSSQFMDTQQHRKRTNKLKFTRSKWSDHAKRVLLNTTVRVDRVCHTLVQTRQRFGVCPTEMRQLSLTVAVMERGLHEYGRQIQESQQKLKRARSRSKQNRNYRSYKLPPTIATFNAATPLIVPSQNQNSTPSTLLLPNTMEPSISAPTNYNLDKAQSIPGDDTEVQSEDSNETIGKCTNPSIVTGTTYYRADSPINQTKLNRHHQKYSSRQAVTRANLRRYNLQQLMTNKGSPSFEYPTTPSIGPNNRTQTQYRRDEQLAWRHPGGVVSLLEILGRVLRSTEEQLVAIGKIANLTDFVQNNKLIWVISIVAGAYIFTVPFRGPIRFMLVHCSKFTTWLIGTRLSKAFIVFLNHMTIKNILFRFIPTKLKNVLMKMIENVLTVFISMFTKLQSISAIESATMWMNRFRFMILPTLIYIIHKCVLKIYLMRLQTLNDQLNSVILHWQLCMTAITPKNRLDQSLNDRLKRIKSYNAKQHTRSLKRGGNADDSSASIDIYQWILRLVPPSAHIDACFWYGANFRLRLLRKLMDINYAVTSFYYRLFGSSSFFWPMAFPILAYYVCNPHRAACRANEFLANPDIRIIRVLYSLLDSKFARWCSLRVFPKLRLMPQLQTAITFEIRVDDINSWSDDNDLNGMSIIDDEDNLLNMNNAPNVKFQNIDTVRIKIFATKKLNIKPDYVNSGDGAEFLNENPPSNLMEQQIQSKIPAHNIINDDVDLNDIEDAEHHSHGIDMRVRMGKDDRLNNIDHDLCLDDDLGSELSVENNHDPNLVNISSPINPRILQQTQSQQLNNTINHNISKQENGVIFYIHGGGFLGNFCASDLRILSQWSELTNAPIVEVDYSLMPSKWPTALQECILAYKCLCYGRLGFNARRIAVIGDSNGGGLAVSMILSIIKDGLRVPDVLILTSPILSLRQTQPTTSRLLFNMDPLIPMNLIVQLTKYYLIPTICDDENDPLISPLIAAPDYLLACFPPTTIVVGGLDPFLDDSIDFAHRLSNSDVNVDVKLKIYKFSPHAFLNFNYILPDVNHAIHLIAECIDDAFHRT